MLLAADVPDGDGLQLEKFKLTFSKINIMAVYVTLLQTAQKLQQQAESLTPDKIDEYEKVKRKLEAISFERTRGACVRSKARWHEFGHPASRAFRFQ